MYIYVKWNLKWKIKKSVILHLISPSFVETEQQRLEISEPILIDLPEKLRELIKLRIYAKQQTV